MLLTSKRRLQRHLSSRSPACTRARWGSHRSANGSVVSELRTADVDNERPSHGSGAGTRRGVETRPLSEPQHGLVAVFGPRGRARDRGINPAVDDEAEIALQNRPAHLHAVNDERRRRADAEAVPSATLGRTGAAAPDARHVSPAATSSPGIALIKTRPSPA